MKIGNIQLSDGKSDSDENQGCVRSSVNSALVSGRCPWPCQ